MKCLFRPTGVFLAIVMSMALSDAAVQKPDDKPLTDFEFVTKAASGGMFEVESSKLANNSGKSEDVKKFAEKMITDHQKANNELKTAAAMANIAVPIKMISEHQKLMDKIKEAKGDEFDKVYLKTQVTAHKEAVEIFTNASKNLQNPALKSFAEKTLPVIKEHYEHVKKLAEKENGDKDK